MIRERGQFLIELLVAIALAAILLPALATAFVAAREGKAQQRERLAATALSREGVEAVRIVREKGWNLIASDATYYPVVTSGTWELTSGIETIGAFTRTIVISSVYRDSTGAIVSSGTVDPSTKKIVVTVSWQMPLPSSVASTIYLTRHQNNQMWSQTTASDFNAGTKTNVVVTNTAGGEVVLAAGGTANWCEPNLSIIAVDLPKQGVANAISAIEGRVFAGTGENSSGVSFANVTTGNTNPPSATVSGTFDGFKTNDVFGETNYAYLATDNNSKEVVIVNLTTNPYSEIGYFNAPGNANAESVFVAGSIGYMTSGNTLYTFDLTSKSGSRPQLGSVTLDGTGSEITVIGGYAYIAIAGSSIELDIVQVASGGALLTKVGTADVNGQAAYDVFVNTSETRAYLATGTALTQREFFIVDITTKTGSRPTVGSYDTNGMDPKGVTVVPGNRAIIVGVGGEEYQVINLSVESLPTRCGGLQVNSGVNGVSSVLEGDGDSYSYSITGDATSELKIIAGGPGGIFSTTGTFESSTLDAGSSVAFNRFVPSAVLPSATTIAYQVAVASAVGGSCSAAEFTYVGPDGTGATQFSGASALPLSTSGGFRNPGQCLRFKVLLTTTDPSQTPEFQDVTVNYSP